MQGLRARARGDEYLNREIFDRARASTAMSAADDGAETLGAWQRNFFARLMPATLRVD